MMKASAIGLACFAGVTTVSGFMSHVIPTASSRSFRAASHPSTASASHPLSRPHRPTASRAQGCSVLKKKGPRHLQNDGDQDPSTIAGRHSVSAGIDGFRKVAVLAVAAAATSQLLPHAAMAAAETAVPLVSAAADGTLVERLTTSGFFQAFSLVFVSEIGDKTFFIAALLAAKTSRLISFAGSVGALAVMTVLAVLLGLAFHSVPSVFTSGLPLDDIIAAAAFLYFGINTLKDAYQLPDDSNEGIDEERAEAEESVKELAGKKTVW